MRAIIHQVPDHPDLFVTKSGVVFQRLTVSPSYYGYHTVHPKGKGGTLRRHRLVCAAFHGPPPGPRHEVRHLDGDPGNDHPDNLAWGTKADNIADMLRHDRSTRGSKNMQAKLTREQVLEIRRRRAAGESGRLLAEEFGVTQAGVCDIHKRRTWSWLEDPQTKEQEQP